MSALLASLVSSSGASSAGGMFKDMAMKSVMSDAQKDAQGTGLDKGFGGLMSQLLPTTQGQGQAGGIAPMGYSSMFAQPQVAQTPMPAAGNPFLNFLIGAHYGK